MSVYFVKIRFFFFYTFLKPSTFKQILSYMNHVMYYSIAQPAEFKIPGTWLFCLFLLNLIRDLFFYLNLQMIYECFRVTCLKKTEITRYFKNKYKNKTKQYKNPYQFQGRTIVIFLTANGLFGSIWMLILFLCIFK